MCMHGCGVVYGGGVRAYVCVWCMVVVCVRACVCVHVRETSECNVNECMHKYEKAAFKPLTKLIF